MAHLNPEASFETIKERVQKAITAQFPFVGKKHRLELVRLEVKDTLAIDDIKSQYDKKTAGGTWEVPVVATLKLVEILTGNTLDESTFTIAKIPKITRRYSFIIEGHERQHDGLFRLKPGIYHRIADNGDIQAQWNLSPEGADGKRKNRIGFKLDIDRASGYLTMGIGTANVPLYSVLKAMNLPDSDIEKALGPKTFEENRRRSKANDLLKIPKTLGRTADAKKVAAKMPVHEAQQFVQDFFANTSLTRPDGSMHNSLGKDFDHVTGEGLLLSGKRLLDISRGKAKEDDRQSLSSKDFAHTEDFIEQMLTNKAYDIQRRVMNNLDNRTRVQDIMSGTLYTKVIRSTFDESQLPEQHNPLQFLSGHLRTTIRSAEFGGVKGERNNLSEDQLINPTHIGFLDPIQTPESESTGITLHLPVNVQKKGYDLYIKVWDRTKNGLVDVRPTDLERAVVAYPDQVTWIDGKPKPTSDNVTVYDTDRATKKRPWKDVRYVLTSSKSLFSFAANLVPFLPTVSGARAMMASKQQEQAVSLKHREAPLVQTKTDGKATFDQVVGLFSAHVSPVEGTVKKVSKEAIELEDKAGKAHVIQLYNHFPLNGGVNMLHSEALVKPGDKVTRLQAVADSNFTRNGHLAIGTNLRVAYVPYNGLNFEDGIVISESASKKLTSMHMHVESITLYTGMELNKKRWVDNATPEQTDPKKMAKLDDEGVIREGSPVAPGDVLVAVLAQTQPRPEEIEAGLIHKSLNRPFTTKRSLSWDHDYPGTVAKVIRSGKSVTVHVRTDEPMTAGDKLTGRYGNKGIISRILPDHEMPHDKEGKPVHVLLSIAGVPGRMNVGQVLETAASKIALKTGKPYIVDNFAPNVDYSEKVLHDLKAHGLSDTEELFDAKTGRSLGKVLTGNQYMLKLHHMVDHKMTARSHGGAYTSDGQPPPGAGIPGGGQKVDQLMIYAMLAHGATANLREMSTWKSDQDQDEVWAALQRGERLPDPKPTRTMGKFTAMMRAMGIHMEKKGSKYILSPFTDKHVAKFSNGEIKFPSRTLTAKGLRTIEDAGGLFDRKVTGGIGGNYWSHMTLTERVPNPIFEKPIQTLTGLNEKEFAALVAADAPETKGRNGFQHIVDLLGKINVKEELARTEKALPTLKGVPMSKAYRKVRYLRALDQLGISPTEAYTTQMLPVVPPSMRRVMVNLDGTQSFDDLNGLYRAIGQINEQIKTADKSTPKSEIQKMKAGLYDAIKGLRMTGTDLGEAGKKRHHMGLMEKMEGTPQPKNSYFQDGLISRRQDLSARSTIIPAPELGLDEIGLPLPIAFEIYKPFIVRELHVNRGFTPLQAQEAMKKKDPAALEALHKVVADRPVLAKRDPALHKFSVMAFHPRLTSGKAIGLHPLVTSGFNADFDGDAMALYLPVSSEAVDEAKNMLPSKNLFSPTTGKIVPVPAQDSLLGLYQASLWGEKAKVPAGTTAAQAVKMVKDGKLKANEVLTIDGKETTGGRLMLAAELPEEMRGHDALLHDPKYKLDKGTLSNMLTEIARKHPQDYARVVDAWKDHGNHLSYLHGSSFGIKDFHDGIALRDHILKPFRAEEAKLHASSASQEEKDHKVVEIYTRAIDALENTGKPIYAKSSNRVYEMASAGASKGWDQFRQLVFGPILVNGPKGDTVPIPITHSFGEGLPLSEYWASMHGARKGTIDRASATKDPGALTKDIMNTVIGHSITRQDCGTTEGAHLSVNDPDVADRFLAQPVKLKDGDLPAGELLTSPILAKLRAEKVDHVVVRSPLHCHERKGICAMCYGMNENGKLYHPGVNVGVIAGHALGEPVTQLTMRTFHSGGAVSGAASRAYETSAFKRAEQLFKVPKTLKGAATVATTDGEITKVVRNVTLGGHDVYVGDKKHYIPADRDVLATATARAIVRKGEALSSGPLNPHDILATTKNMGAVRSYITDEILSIYPKGVRRRNVETVVHAMTNVTHIDHAPGHPEYTRGQLVPLSKVDAANREAAKTGEPVIHHTPMLKSITEVPLSIQEDWMARANYRKLKQTYEEGAAQAWSSDIHESTIAGLAHGAEFGLKKKIQENRHAG